MSEISTQLRLLLLFLFISTSIEAQNTEIKYLSGTGSDNTVQWDFFCTAGNNSGKWSQIEVPSCWELQSFGQYNYGSHAPQDRLNEEGKYRYSFVAEKSWQGKNVQIVFDGVMTDCEVKINGKLAGNIHQGAFYQFKYNISELLKHGKKNLLEVHVKKHSDNESVNSAERFSDYWIFGGIIRPVFLEIKPEEHIDRVAVDAKADGSFTSEVVISPLISATKINVEILNASNNVTASFSKNLSGETGKVQVKGKMPNPELWSPEFPNLYTANFQLLDESGNTIHQVKEKIGFRTVEVRAEDGIYINGRKIKFKGVNRHTFHPDYGRTSSKALSINDVKLIKSMNMNAVRMSHYPPESHFLDVCDSLGLFVLDELAGWQSCYDSIVGRKLLVEMIERDVNHPSIVIWDNGNEGGWNTAYDDDFAQLDIQKREVIHPWQNFRKTNTAHYINYDYLSRDNFDQRKIFFPTEFLHGLYDGGHGAGLKDYWLRMWNDPLCAGGFLWVFADECVNRTDTRELDCDGNHAPDGILGPYHEKEGSYYTIREIWSPLFIEKRNITPEFNGLIAIENRYHFTETDQCNIEYQWVKLPGLDDRNIKPEVLSEGKPELRNLSPGERGTMKIDLTEDWQNADALAIRATDPDGNLIHKWVWPVKSPEKKYKEIQAQKDLYATEAKTKDETIVLTAGDLKLEFSNSTGLLKKVLTSGGEIPFHSGPELGSAGMECEHVECFAEDGKQIIKATYANDRMKIRWILHPNAILDMEVSYHQPPENRGFAGISFQYPEEEIINVRYMGNGPYRVWKNRMDGVAFGLWDKKYNNSITGYQEYEYPEFKGYYSQFYSMKIEAKNSPGFKVYCKSKDIFLRLFTPGEAPDPANTSLIHPSGDISFMHGIPAIGTKFKKAEQLGPNSGEYSYTPKRIEGGALSMFLSFEF